ncbi:ROK family protein [Streptomyces sp. GC420]|uniref:ROK family protein n=1 Tax=Streptomyces sp. GC420 TaxID=2697568 RepID=UPI001414F88A|nr:ROK family protein [Streptomyces sp. GC420]NBM20658.1 ROK family protein [Streptomyces sp. GC420]
MRTVAGRAPISRAAVAGQVGLTRAAVSTLVDELVRAGLLVELGPEALQSSGVGRPGSALALNDRGPAGIGAEIGVDHLAACAVDLRGEVRARVRVAADNRGRPAGPVLAELAALVDRVAGEARAEGLRPAGLAVAVPGLVTRDGHTVVRAPNLGWSRVDLGPALRDAPAPLSVDNEANLGALAELWTSGGSAPQDFVHVSAEIGIGAAIVVDGRLLRGRHGFAGELGHVPIHPDGPACVCGGRGCLEQYAGEEAVLRAAGLASGPGAIDVLAEHAARGDEAARGALRDAGSALGIALAGAVNLLDPETVVLGGALSRLAPWLLPALEEELGRRVTDPDRPHRGTVTVSRLGSDGPLLGAAHAVVQAVLDDPVGGGTPGG